MTEKKSKDEMVVSEIRMSLFETDATGAHTKHVALTITHPTLCSLIADLVGKSVDLAKVPDAHHETIEPKKGKDKDAA